ncbi:MAG: hypothetical protein JXR96_12285 [Deltaproteobacteria bacterium]|nr:hypothetical protein [Deltaproteobacteria bacterium]
MSYDLFVTGRADGLSREAWIEELGRMGLEVDLHPGVEIPGHEGGFVPARLALREDCALMSELRPLADAEPDLESLVDLLEQLRETGPVLTGFELQLGEESTALSFGARDPASAVLLTFCAALAAARITGGQVEDPQTGLGLDPARAGESLGRVLEEEFDLFMAEAEETPFEAW